MNLYTLINKILIVENDEIKKEITLQSFAPTEFDLKYDSDNNFSTIPDPKNFASLEEYLKYEKDYKQKEDKEYFPMAVKMYKDFNNGVLFEYYKKDRYAKFIVKDNLHFLFHLKYPEGKIKKILKLNIYINTIIYLIKLGIDKICKMYIKNEDLPGNYMFIINKFYNGLIKIPIEIRLNSKNELIINKKFKIVKNKVNEDENEEKKYVYIFNVLIPTVLISKYQKFNIKNDQIVIIENKNYRIIKI